MRPRILIYAINTCKSFALDRGHERIEEADVKDGLRVVSLDLVNEIGLEMRDVFPVVEDALYMLIGTRKILNEDEVKRIFDEHQVGTAVWDRLIELFLWYGVLGVDILGKEPMYIYGVNYDLKILKGVARGVGSGQRAYVVNPAFHAALDVL